MSHTQDVIGGDFTPGGVHKPPERVAGQRATVHGTADLLVTEIVLPGKCGLVPVKILFNKFFHFHALFL